MPELSEKTIEEHFLAVADLTTGARRDALEDLKTTDPELAVRLKILLDADKSNRDDGLLGLDSSSDGCRDEDEAVPIQIGNYEIQTLVGKGGMGAVYAALHPGTGRQCALKLMHHGFATRQNLQRFYREAKALARLDHPGIARIYDAGSAEAVYANGERSQRPFIAMEFVKGQNILNYVQEEASSAERCAALMADAAEALHHAHQCGIIHRDIKPGNILVDEQGAVKVLDFGIARVAGSEDQTTGFMPGTAAYMSPEQMAGLRNRIDTRTDVYALGATLYALVTGYQPSLRLASPGANAAWRTGPRDRRLNAILEKAMAWEPENRYTSAAQFADDLRGWIAGTPILARPDRLDWLRRLRRNYPRSLYSLIGGVVLVGVVATQPDWRLRLHARLLPPTTHTVLLLNFTTPSDPGGTSPLPTQFNRWAAQELQAGVLLRPMQLSPGGLGAALPQGSSLLLPQAEVAKLRKLGANYALVGDYDVSGDQPWSTLKLQARLIDVADQKTVEVASAQGSLAEAQGLVSEMMLDLTQSAGKREQFLRLRHQSHPENDRLYAEGVALFANHDYIKARTALEASLNGNYSNTSARLALARVLDALGYHDLARKHAALAVDFTSGESQRIDAQALTAELDGHPEEGLRLRDSIATPKGQGDGWMAQTSYLKDLLATDQRDRAGAEIASAIAGGAQHLHWMTVQAAYIRILKGRPGWMEQAQTLMAEARHDGSPLMVADASIILSEASIFAGQAKESFAALQDAEKIYSSEGDREGRARAMLMMGQRIQVHGRNGDAIRILSDALREVTGAGFVAVEQQILQLLGSAYGRGYDPEISRQMLSRALVLSWSQPEQYSTRQVLQRLGITLTLEGNLTEARRILKSALPEHVERGEPAARTFNAMGEADLVAGDTKAVLADAEQATKLGAGAPDVVSDALLLKTRAMALDGDYSAVDANFRKALELAEKRGMSGSLGNEQFEWGECLLENGAAAAAVSHLLAAERQFGEIDRPADQASAAALLATAYVKLKKLSDARAALARAAEIGSVYKFAYPRILFELAEAQVAAAQGQWDEARRLYESVRDDATRVGFVPQVKAAEAALENLNRGK